MVHICQCLCLNRHCILAFAYDTVDGTPEKFKADLKTVVEGAIEAKLINP